MTPFLWGLAVFLLVNASLCLVRAYLGPTAADRLLAINVVGTKTLVVLSLLAFVFHRSLFVDVALVYGLLNFIVTIAASRLVETGHLRGDWQ
ncbi:monovalent cation/H+ antiporter complex subunit F [Anaerosoma tenue]|jgi:multicomponent Na+:H+ antiporter subunit F|uniref:monovalent cation/H+ antiporter complex subunit F n=1 Tax=Anaerosoma tenue TaxID=2933588 RepID=UPI002260C07B|nr:monovalent cation/H+ antiporter complex subunit F [Anaerosoma tenue]MCK8115212.1 monovalent cation/H+ antiporter complex subunit F [Anaerosoma tenue]